MLGLPPLTLKLFEIKKSKFLDRARQILPWANGAVVNVLVDETIRRRAKDFESNGRQ